ncbi:unnamed protein product, partial [Closterium sp. Naga37s-1]
MASTLLEQARATHEENERLERQAVRDLQQSLSSHREKLFQSHRIKNVVDAIVANSARLVRRVARQHRRPAAKLAPHTYLSPKPPSFRRSPPPPSSSPQFPSSGIHADRVERSHPPALALLFTSSLLSPFPPFAFPPLSPPSAPLGTHGRVGQAEIYADADGARRDEIAALGGQGTPNPSATVFTSFYERLNEIREYHRRHPGARVVEGEADVDELIKDEPWVQFSGEEAMGKHVDMNEAHQQFCNAKFGRSMDYAAFLDQLPQTHKIPRNFKFTKAYRAYMGGVAEYLESFFLRTHPLQDLPTLYRKLEEDFRDRWEQGQVLGWEDQGLGWAGVLRAEGDRGEGEEEDGEGGEGYGMKQGVVDLSQFDTVDELLDEDLVPPAKVKEALGALGLKTGGTPRERAERLLMAKTTRFEAIDPKHLAKSFAPPKKKGAKAAKGSAGAAADSTNGGSGNGSGGGGSVAREVALVEAKVQRLCELLEEEEVVEEEEEESEEEEEEIYNPLKLPMGWDGKPIPYWLYKLHGLNQEFKCEICGNYSYWGRRAFERHFREFRHQHGMRCLGVPNTKAFHEVTVIKDALALWERMREKQGGSKWRPEVEEECEDREGNVYDRKTFQDLRRQGII